MAAVPSSLQPIDLRKANTPWWALAAKWGLLGLVLLFGAFLIQRLLTQGYWLAVVGAAFVLMCIMAVYGTRRAVPLKYLLPGLILLVALQIWPIVYTVATAFTNYGQGHILSKEDATTQTILQSVKEVEGAQRYKMSIAIPEGQDPATAPLTLLLTKPDGSTYAGTADGLAPLQGTEKAENGKITKAPGFTILNFKEANKRSAALSALVIPTGDGKSAIKYSGLSEAFEGAPTLTYDKGKDTLTQTVNGKTVTYVPKNSYWTATDGSGALPTGWQENVGAKNFKTLLTNETIRAGFVKIFAWNVAFAALSVLSTFILGMLLALLFNDDRLRGKGFYRSLLILPYAIPGFVTSLVWASMFNQEFGLVNSLTRLNVDWLGDPWAAKAAILITNLWLGFPYMFLVCTGALQSIPTDVREAAKIDGANAFRTLRSIIMPLLLVAVGPLLIASFAFNFNNFTLIFLLTGGGPFESGDSSIGSTDLLITYAFRLAFSGVSPNLGLASAVCIFIFFIVALMSYSGFRRTASLEEVN